MRSQNPIADYAAALSRELAFDARLSRRVRTEVEDHLWEAASEGSVAAQRSAVARFGDPREIAAQYAASSLYRQTKTVGTAVALVVAGIYLAMKGRLAWYGLMHWAMGPRLHAAVDGAMPVIRYTFMAAVVLGIIGWAYSASRTIPSSLGPAHRRQLRIAQLLSTAATAAVSLSVIFDLAVTTARLADTSWSAQALVPLGLMAAEIALAIALAARLFGAVRRTTLVASRPDLMRPN